MEVLRERFVGDLSDKGTPGPISNPAVKLVSADGSRKARVGQRLDFVLSFLQILKKNPDYSGFFFYLLISESSTVMPTGQ
mgnify:CR=1 FL=1